MRACTSINSSVAVVMWAVVAQHSRAVYKPAWTWWICIWHDLVPIATVATPLCILALALIKLALVYVCELEITTTQCRGCLNMVTPGPTMPAWFLHMVIVVWRTKDNTSLLTFQCNLKKNMGCYLRRTEYIETGGLLVCLSLVWHSSQLHNCFINICWQLDILNVFQ